jgi:hypothetical protein
LATVLSLCVAGCGTTATITRGDGGRVEGRISGGSFDEIWLVDPKGSQHRIPRNEIVDIAHPGAAAAGVGAALLLLGALRIHSYGPNCTERGDAGCFQVYGPAALGAGMLAWGGALYSGSVRRAKPGLVTTSDPPSPTLSRQLPPSPSYAAPSPPPAASPPAPPDPVRQPPPASAPSSAPVSPPAVPLAPVPQRVEDDDS